MIKVMSFNIRYGTANDGANSWHNRKVFALSRIQEFEPDLLGLQECRDDEQAEFVKTNLPAYQFFGAPRGGGGSTALEMAPILFRAAAFRLVRSGLFWLSETPHVAGSKSWDSAFARTATWVKLIHLPSGKPLTFINTHFDYQPAAIEASARVLQNWLAGVQEESPVILTGDFNADKNSAAYLRLVNNATLFDAHRLANPDLGDETTYHEFGKLNKRTAIDWIVVSDQFKVVHAEIDRAQAGDLFPSDHFPALAALDWKTESDAS
jgi:endonuclease/exonuclease/phosphatase family metal-dependent hydrolase